jgi:outer membrane protein assembly factor BamD (BamD/ComL family)
MILTVFLCSVKLLTPANANEPPPSVKDIDRLFEQAGIYEDAGDSARAEQIYEDIIQGYPGTEYALEAQRDIVCQYVTRHKQQEAEAALQEFVEVYSEHAGAAKAVCQVANRYLDTNPAKALELYQYTMENWPSMEDAIWAQLGKVKASLRCNDKASADDAYQKLITQFLGHSNLAETVYEAALWYEDFDAPKALEIYEYAANTWPDYDNWTDSDDAILPQVNLALWKIDLGDKEGADAVCDNIMNNFLEDNNIALVINELADAYMVSGERQKALELYKHAKRLGAEGGRGIWSDVASLKSDIMLDNDRDNKKVGKLVAGHSEDPELGTAVFSVAQQYYREAFARENKGDKSKAKKYFQKAGALYRTIVEELPESTTGSVAIESRLLAGETYRRLGEPAKAIPYYEEIGQLACLWERSTCSISHWLQLRGIERYRWHSQSRS